MQSKVFLEILSDVVEDKVFVTVKTYVALFIYTYIEQPHEIDLNLVKFIETDNSSIDDGLEINIAKFSYKCFTKQSFEQEIASVCHLPVLITPDNVIIAGLCGVSRGSVKQQNSPKYLPLLGFKGSCLLAPSETSTWTRFCEIDFIICTKNILKSHRSNEPVKASELVEEIGKFEGHMSQPIRVHNIYKLARELANETLKVKPNNLPSLENLSLNEHKTENKQSIGKGKEPRLNKTRKSKIRKNVIQIPSNTPVADLNLDHTYVEGQQITLADLIIFACFSIIMKQIEITTENLPLTCKWINSVRKINSNNIERCEKSLTIIDRNYSKMTFSFDVPKNFSLYKSDVKRYKPRDRIFTRQTDISEALDKINDLGLIIESKCGNTLNSNAVLDWSSIPIEAMPEGGALPPNRLERKKDQLQSLAKEVINMARPNDRIVDFCSGAGHLGIVLAYKLPYCSVILLENKEDSLMRAKQRVDTLQLKNILFVQSNLDYFRGSFNIGTSLHACGVATDIVLAHCMNQRANFVCCPCCYGGIQPMHHIQYPRSELFQSAGITNHDYMHIAHCADQAHDIDKVNCNIEKSRQGQYCMDIVDTDRKLMAEECGYRVTLTRLTPENCTPKNRLLIGFLMRSK